MISCCYCHLCGVISKIEELPKYFARTMASTSAAVPEKKGSESVVCLGCLLHIFASIIEY